MTYNNIIVEKKGRVGMIQLSRPQTLNALNKVLINVTFEDSLTEGIRFEKRIFHTLFAMEDQTEGTTAFIEKREPVWKNK